LIMKFESLTQLWVISLANIGWLPKIETAVRSIEMLADRCSFIEKKRTSGK